MTDPKPRATVSGRAPEDPAVPGAPAPIDPVTGQHKDHYVLPEEERAKGYIRPLRFSYTHAGRLVCGKPKNKNPDQLEGEEVPDIWVCLGAPGHEGPCGTPGYGRNRNVIGCQTSTRMPASIAETWAADPKYYGETFCVGCKKYLPVGEFVWDGSIERLGD